MAGKVEEKEEEEGIEPGCITDKKKSFEKQKQLEFIITLICEDVKKTNKKTT